VSLACSVAIITCGVALFNWWAISGLPILSEEWHYQVSNRFPLAAIALVGGIVLIRLLTWGAFRGIHSGERGMRQAAKISSDQATAARSFG